MSHPLIWPRKHFFYPIGNTPAICLTAGLAPEKRADVLLLGCGDVRNILYTIHADHGLADRPMDFTCCDYDPAVLARNLMFFTILMDNEGAEVTSMLWNIYYHFYLDKATLDFLLQSVQRLIDASVDLYCWNKSRYGKHLKFCTEHALSEIRRYWNYFAETGRMSTPDMDQLKNSFSAGMRKTRLRHGGRSVNTVFRCGGLLALMLEEVGPEHFRFFWETGVTAGSEHGIFTNQINPTFAFSLAGKGFNVHYGTDPILGFHFALVLSAKHKTIRKEDLVDSAKAQFKEWCLAFQRKVKLSSDTLKIRFFLGDALAFANALTSCAANFSIDTAIYTYPWGNNRVLFDQEQYGKGKGGPFAFDVIDTSNLSDHLGMLNVFLTTIPLLKSDPSSLLNTSSLLAPDDGDCFSGLTKALRCDPHLFSLIFGVMPTALWSSIGSYSNTQEILRFMVLADECRQFYEPVCWRQFPQCDSPRYTIEISSRELGQVLFQIYYDMFADSENAIENLVKLRDVKTKNLGPLIHYNRNTFAMVLKRLKSRVSFGWDEAMDVFHDLVVRDRRLLIGSNSYQDMCCSLHMHGVHSVDTLRDDFIRRTKVSVGERGPFKAWTVVPPVICVVLEVPRSHLKVLESMDPDEIMSPILQCEIKGPGFHNVHSSVQAVFGRITSSGRGEHRKLVVIEDPERWDGDSSLIVSFYMPSWILTVDPANTHAGLHIRSTPTSVFILSPKLGFTLRISSSNIMDAARVHIVSSRPGNDKELESVQHSTAIPNKPETSIKVHLNEEFKTISALSIKTNITDIAEQTALAKKAPVMTCQTSRNIIQATFAGYRKEFRFMVPVDGARSKLRIARTSFYLEIEAPIAHAELPFIIEPFPVILQDGHLNAWNIHYLNLDHLPDFICKSPSLHSSISAHLGMMLSDSEREEKKAVTDTSKQGALLNLKQSIGNIFLVKAGVGKVKGISVFQLCNPGNGGTHTFIFVNSIKFDLASHTLVADAYVLPLTDEIVENTSHNLLSAIRHGAVDVRVTVDESISWCHLMPVLVERCRTWKHDKNCEYVSRGRVPLSTSIGTSPICSCGKGKDLGRFTDVKEWRPFASFVTRIALSPLFCASFLGHFSKPSNIIRETNDKKLCSRCLKTSTNELSVCGACKKTRYCSSACQKADWKEHKPNCKK